MPAKLSCAAWALLLALVCSSAAKASEPSTLDLEVRERAQGNRIDHARALARVLLATLWPAQILKVRVDGVGAHEVAGLTLSAVKFHASLDQPHFEDEVEALVQKSFAASAVEEVDVWATVPIPYDKREPVSGDYAQPTTRVVFALTCRRSELHGLDRRLRSADGVYWSDDFKQRLSGGSR